MADKITFSLSDGLDECDPAAADTVVIAGMGGDTICRILDRAEWTMSDAVSLILQPMTKAEVLRYWLSCNGYCIEKELLVPENGKLFRILLVRFRNQNTFLSDAELFLGQKELAKQNSAFPLLLEEEVSRLRKKLKGLRLSRPDSPEISFYSQILSEMEDS